MNGTAAQHEAEKILAELPDQISDVIKPFARHSPDHPALVQGDVIGTYAELAAVVADTAGILKFYDIRPGDRVMIVSENSLALAALILAVSEIDAWSVVMNPRLSAREVDLIREHSGARRVFYAIEVSDAAREHADRARPRSSYWMRCRPPRPVKSSSTGSPRSLVTGISRTLLVVPAKAGIQGSSASAAALDPRLRGGDV